MANDLNVKRGGRPKLQPDDLPLVLAKTRSRVRETLPMTAPTLKELKAYARWVAKRGQLSDDEALSLVLDEAVRDLIRRDKVWTRVQNEEAMDQELEDAIGVPRSAEDLAEHTRPAAPVVPPRNGASGAASGGPSGNSGAQ